MAVRTRTGRAARRPSAERAVALASGAVAAALPVLGFLGSAPGLAAQLEAYDCGDGAVFVVSGTDDPNFLHTRGVETRYIAQGYVIKRVDYPATFWPLGAQSYDENIEIGQAALTRDVATYQANCPGNPAVIAGYSQGARIAGDALADIAAGKADGVTSAGVSGELYSDPRRRGTDEGAGAEVNLINAYPGAMLDGSRAGDFGELTVYSICIDGDAVCDVPDPRRDPIGALDALLGFWVKHYNYGDIMAAGPGTAVGTDGVSVIEGSDDATVIFIDADPSLTIVLAQVGLPNLLRPVILDFPYAELAVVRPISRAIMGLLPALPQLGHGAYLTDLYAIRDALSGDPAAWSAIFGSAVSVVRYPVNFVRDWVAVIDAVLDHRDPDLGFIAAPTVRAVAVAALGAVSEARLGRGDLTADTPEAGISETGISEPEISEAGDSPTVLAESSVDDVQAPAAGLITGPVWNAPETSHPDQGADEPGPDDVDVAGSVADQGPAVPAKPSSPAPAGTVTTPVDQSADLAADW